MKKNKSTKFELIVRKLTGISTALGLALLLLMSLPTARTTANETGNSNGSNDGVDKHIPLIITKTRLSLADIDQMLEAAKRGKQILVGAGSKLGRYVDRDKLLKIALYNKSLYRLMINGDLDPKLRTSKRARNAHMRKLERFERKLVDDLKLAEKVGTPAQVRILKNLVSELQLEIADWLTLDD